jgi:hypothetical protein
MDVGPEVSVFVIFHHNVEGFPAVVSRNPYTTIQLF